MKRGKIVMDMVKWSRSKKPTLEELKEMLAGQGLECELYSDPPRVKYGRHKHPFDDFVVIVSGKMKIMTDKLEWTLTPGDRLDIPANTPHSAEVLGRVEVQYLSAAK
jgi:quercetin dioxygenase-like cupin family protein